MAVESPRRASIGGVVAVPSTVPAASGHWAQAWRQLRRDRAALFAPLLAPYDYTAQNMANRYAAPGGVNVLGTDHLGRDVLSRLMFGARISLAVGLISVGIAVSFGVTIGALAGYVGGRTDLLLMWVMD